MRRSRTLYYGHRKKSSGTILKLLSLFLLGFIIWGGYLFFREIISNAFAQPGTAKLSVIEGRTEVQLDGTSSDSWTTAFSGQQFLAGDRIRSLANGKVSLDIFAGNSLFLDNKTEIKLITLEKREKSKKIIIELIKGQIWAKFSESLTPETGNEIIIVSKRSQVHVTGTILNVSSSDVQDTVRLIKGNAHIEVNGEDDGNPHKVEIGVGQQVVISSLTAEKLQNNKDVVSVIAPEFIEGEWHLKNLERFFPEESNQIRRRIEIIASRSAVEEAREKIATLDPPEINTPAQNTVFPLNTDVVKIEGITSSSTSLITVNGYTLTKYTPGNKKWHYFAAKKFGTLVSGKNVYRIQSISRDGKKSDEIVLTLFVQDAAGSIPDVSTQTLPPKSSEKLTLEKANTFSAPEIIYPVVLNTISDTYQTAVPLVTIRGGVDPKTNAVEVNGYRLKKFTAGDTKFSYIANADRGNMQEGENTYTVVAFGPDRKQSKTTFKIFYQPIKE